MNSKKVLAYARAKLKTKLTETEVDFYASVRRMMNEYRDPMTAPDEEQRPPKAKERD